MGLSGGLSTNGQTAQSAAIQAGGVLMPLSSGGYPGAIGTAAIGTAFKSYFMRAIVPKSGVLHDIAVYNGATVNGNTNVAVFDCGDTTAGTYTPLWSAGTSVTMSGGSAWQIIGDPALTVFAGQHVMLAMMNNGATATFGTKTSATTAAANGLPASFLPAAGGASAKMSAIFTFSDLNYIAVTEANMVVTSPQFAIIGRIV